MRLDCVCLCVCSSGHRKAIQALHTSQLPDGQQHPTAPVGFSGAMRGMGYLGASSAPLGALGASVALLSSTAEC